MKAQHTPGNWTLTLEGSVVHGTLIQGKTKHGGEFTIAELHTRQGTKETKANARLIAACPELLAACKRALTEIIPQYDNGAINILKDAISKAEGIKL
jgi:hypothetical protein